MAVPPIIEAAEFEAVQALLKTAQPGDDGAACRQRPDAPYRHLLLRRLRRGDDAAHRQERPVPLLHLLAPRPGRARPAARAAPFRWKSSTRWWPITSSSACCSRNVWRKSCPRVLDRREERAERRTAHIAELRKRAAEADAKLKRLYDAIENGVADALRPDAQGPHRRTEGHPRSGPRRRRAGRGARSIGSGRAITPQALKTFARAARKAHADRERRLPPRSPARARPARRSRRERNSHHGIEKRAAAHARRRVQRKNGRFWSAQFCTEVARPKRFELLTPRFVVLATRQRLVKGH